MRGIYCIHNITNGKRYIGQSTNIESRWAKHRYELKVGKHKSTKLQNAYNLHGANSFQYQVLEEVPDAINLDEVEIYWIKYYDAVNSGYNAEHGGNKYKVLTPDHKSKISKWNKGKSLSTETKEKISKALIGKLGHIWSEEQKMAHSEFMRGKQYRLGKSGQKYTQETKNKMSKAKIGNTNAVGSKRTPEEIQRIIETNHKKKGKKYGHTKAYLLKKGLIQDQD